MLNLVVREIVERAQNDRQVNITIASHGLRPARDLLRLVRTPPHRLKTRAQVFPRNHPVDLQKRLVLGVKTGIPVPKIEKPHLTHQPRSSRYQQIVNPDSKSMATHRKRRIFRGARYRPDNLSRLRPRISACVRIRVQPDSDYATTDDPWLIFSFCQAAACGNYLRGFVSCHCSKRSSHGVLAARLNGATPGD